MDLERLERYVLLREENPKVDLKWEQCLDHETPSKTKALRIEFATDVASIANSKNAHDDPNGYLIIGVPDAHARNVPPHTTGCAPFDNADEAHIFNQRIQQVVDLYCDPSLDVLYREYHIAGRLVGLVTVYSPPVLPVFIHNTGREETDWVVWVRSGKGHPGKRRAKGNELRQFFLDYLRTLNPYMTDEDWKRYEARVKRLTRAAPADRIAFLATELVQAHIDRRALACRALGEITGLDNDAKRLAVQLVIGALYDEEPSVQWEAIRALGQLRDDKGIAPLRALYPEVSQELEVEIVNAIRTIGGGTAVTTLRSILDKVSNDEVQEHAKAALSDLID